MAERADLERREKADDLSWNNNAIGYKRPYAKPAAVDLIGPVPCKASLDRE
jgi:hypothetical protein